MEGGIPPDRLPVDPGPIDGAGDCKAPHGSQAVMHVPRRHARVHARQVWAHASAPHLTGPLHSPHHALLLAAAPPAAPAATWLVRIPELGGVA